jgi:glycosyltransferase involved in cell wall biosynthesis
VVQNGLDLKRVDRIRTEKHAGSDDGRFRIAVLGRLEPIKDVITAVRSFKAGCDGGCSLEIIGDGAEKENLMREVRSLGIENSVRFLGKIPREAVYEHLDRSRLLISASRGEGLPVGVLEALACGCPVVLSDIPPHREIAMDADFIPLVSCGDVGGFAGMIRRYQAMPASERQELVEKGRRLIAERFQMETMLARYSQIFSEIAGPRVG